MDLPYLRIYLLQFISGQTYSGSVPQKYILSCFWCWTGLVLLLKMFLRLHQFYLQITLCRPLPLQVYKSAFKNKSSPVELWKQLRMNRWPGQMGTFTHRKLCSFRGFRTQSSSSYRGIRISYIIPKDDVRSRPNWPRFSKRKSSVIFTTIHSLL